MTNNQIPMTKQEDNNQRINNRKKDQHRWHFPVIGIYPPVVVSLYLVIGHYLFPWSLEFGQLIILQEGLNLGLEQGF